MNSERRILLLALAALAATACMGQRQAPKPPEFPAGGLLALSVPPPNPYSLANVLEGVYDTSSRFGSQVVVHASQWGGLNGGVRASVAILANDHYAFANLQPGCLPDNVVQSLSLPSNLVLEGYWRYLDESDPTPSSTGLVRLFVTPAAAVTYVCGAPAWNPATDPPGDGRPYTGGPATLGGATGSGQNAPGTPLTVTWVQPRKSRCPAGSCGNFAGGQPTFLVGVHHGACQTTDNCGISENTPETSILATQLGGEYLEIDTRLTKDNVPVFFHLKLNPAVVQGPYCTGSVEDYNYAELLANCRLRNGEVIPRVVDMMSYVLSRTKLPMYLDSKTPDVVAPVAAIITELDGELPQNASNPANKGFVRCNPGPGGVPVAPPAGKRCLFPGSAPVSQRAVIGLPDSDSVSAYTQAKAAGQLSPAQHCLIEEAVSDVTGVPCVAWMPRYTRGPMTSDVQSLQQQGYFVGFWTINDPATIDAFLTTAVPNGILTNYLGLLNQRFEAVGVVPPNTPCQVSASCP